MKKLFIIFCMFSFIFVKGAFAMENDVNSKKNVDVYDAEYGENNFSYDDELPRLKRIYLGAYAGYVYNRDDKLSFSPVNNCNGLNFDFICNSDGSINPIKTDTDGQYFLAGYFGINSAGPLRLEFGYYTLGDKLLINGQNNVDLDVIQYSSQLDIKGGSVNLYIDFIGNRRRDIFTFTPYVMAGIGISQVELDDIVFNGKDTTFHIVGNKQRNKTIIYGAGLTAGLNNYISLDIGYRYYDFGTISTGNKLNSVDGLQSYDLQLNSPFEAHIGIIGLKFQI